jgi:hypothetical protein
MRRFLALPVALVACGSSPSAPTDASPDGVTVGSDSGSDASAGDATFAGDVGVNMPSDGAAPVDVTKLEAATGDGSPPDAADIIDVGAASEASDATTDALGMNDASACGTCSAGNVCVVIHGSGGAIQQPDDAGACPAGTEHSGPFCVYSQTTYACKPTPASCTGTPTCGCAQSLCPGCPCQSASSVQIYCVCQYP